jgi:hypothetical protein
MLAMLQQTLTVLAVAALVLAGGCATAPPGPGSTRAAVLQHWGQPTAVYALPNGAERIEFSGGPWGQQTWMVDVDAGGRVVQTRQTRSEAEFAALQAAYSQATGMTGQEVLRRIGTPSEISGIWRGGIAWSWRYASLDCRWFWVAMNVAGQVTGSGYDLDPWCARETVVP